MEIAKRLYEENLTPGQLLLDLYNKGKRNRPTFYRSDLQAEFDKDVVEKYRLIGYENRMLSKQDFDDDTVKNFCNNAGVLGFYTQCCKLIDVWFPPVMLEQYDGPSYTLDDMRRYLGVYNRPILGTIIKPKM